MELFGAEVRLRQMARLRNFVRKNGPRGFRAVLFRMVPKLSFFSSFVFFRFRAVLFRMVPKPPSYKNTQPSRFRAVLFRMVPKQRDEVPLGISVLELCCFEWFQNTSTS